jgi:hypothetical protein
MNFEIRAPRKMPPGNHIWNLFSILFIVVLPEYMSAIMGLQAASVHPLPKPIKSVEISKVVKPPAYIVIMMPIAWATNATLIIFAGPKVWYTKPPIIIEIGNPRNHMELINPSCSADRPKLSPSWGRIPARIEKVKAVVMSAKQLPLNKALLLTFSFIKLGFKV